MALSGTAYQNVSNGGAVWRLQIEWTATQNTTAKTSSVTARLYWMSMDQYGAISASGTKTCGVRHNNGTYTTASATPGLTANQKKLIQTYTFTITHNATTGAATFTLGAYFAINITLSGSTVSQVTIANTTFTLDTINAAGKMWVNIDGVWHRGVVWVNVDGTWKQSTGVYTNVDGTWKKNSS